jgi:hypothetical protein
MRSQIGSRDVPKCLWPRPRLRYSAHLRQPLALDWMAAPLHNHMLKTCLSCPSPEPETNWHLPRQVACHLTGTVRGNRCVSRSRSDSPFAGPSPGTLNLYRGLCGTDSSHTK